MRAYRPERKPNVAEKHRKIFCTRKICFKNLVSKWMTGYLSPSVSFTLIHSRRLQKPAPPLVKFQPVRLVNFRPAPTNILPTKQPNHTKTARPLPVSAQPRLSKIAYLLFIYECSPGQNKLPSTLAQLKLLIHVGGTKRLTTQNQTTMPQTVVVHSMALTLASNCPQLG